MGLNGLLDITMAVPNSDELMEFWLRRGMRRTDDGVLGTEDRPVQLRITEGSYRHLTELHLSCETEQDLADIAARLGALGVGSDIAGTALTCIDPVFGHRVLVEVGAPIPLTAHEDRDRGRNRAGETSRIGSRSGVVLATEPRAPRRLGHVVLGTPHLEKATAFMFDGLGVRISDQILGGLATFGRVEADHHNLLIQPCTVSHFNHYAMEMDDVDAIGIAGQAVLTERPDADVVGIGRHFLGSNVFWYLQDPSGTTFEFFTDMDQILDDEAWDRDFGRRDWEGADGHAPFAVWGPKEPEHFFMPVDLDAIGAAREAAGLA
jgi:catechol 2,3-dioxygenase-like lactoylglutathione lyase family enzyme